MNKLVFVYNGDSGLINGIMHYIHKCMAPGTYPCKLCTLVYDGIGVNQEWLGFLENLGIPVETLHRNEYVKRYGNTRLTWPAVLLHDNIMLQAVVLSGRDFDSIPTLDVLMQRVGDFVSVALPETATA